MIHDNNDQFTISFELLRLMQWIVEHEQEGLKRLIARALSQGSNNQLADEHGEKTQGTDLQHNIIDFFMLMEALLIETMSERSVKQALQQRLIPAVNRVDTADCDNSTVRFSLERATSQFQHNPAENPRELFMKELLKRWKPDKKNASN